jgi:hypothetical protein
MEHNDFKALLPWFQTLANDIRNAGTPAEITSGLACVHHRLAEFTKDCDIWIPPASLAAFKLIAATRTWQNCHASYRSSISAPLDSRWLNGGWSSHIIWKGDTQACIDVFGLLPRTIQHIGGSIYSDEETLARVKMTKREKDWPTVHALGIRLVAQKNPTGLLFLQKADSLLQAKTQFSPEEWAVQAQNRPLLNAVETATDTQHLDAYLQVEQTFWRKVDQLRLDLYRKSCKDYAKLATKALATCSKFDEQDAELIKIAEVTLPENPLHNMATHIVENATDQALTLIDPSKFHSPWLPTDWAAATIRVCYAPERPCQNRELN